MPVIPYTEAEQKEALIIARERKALLDERSLLIGKIDETLKQLELLIKKYTEGSRKRVFLNSLKSSIDWIASAPYSFEDYRRSLHRYRRDCFKECIEGLTEKCQDKSAFAKGWFSGDVNYMVKRVAQFDDFYSRLKEIDERLPLLLEKINYGRLNCGTSESSSVGNTDGTNSEEGHSTSAAVDSDGGTGGDRESNSPPCEQSSARLSLIEIYNRELRRNASSAAPTFVSSNEQSSARLSLIEIYNIELRRNASSAAPTFVSSNDCQPSASATSSRVRQSVPPYGGG